MRKLVIAACAAAALITGCTVAHPGPSAECRALFARESMTLGRMGDLENQQPKGWYQNFLAASAANGRALAQMRAQGCPMELKAYA